MSLSNTLFDVVCPNILSDNDISVKFPDNDDELLDADEFHDLNKGPNPEFFLNLQDGKA